jgi:outer membrane protein OmpA-like peptidoglycan-associated protein
MMGCSASPPLALQEVTANYDQARRNENIKSNAPVAWQEAERSLDRAQTGWDHDGDKKETAHLAYLAQRRLEIAKARSDSVAAEESIKNLAAQRDELVLQTRTREATQARRQADIQREEAEKARQIAEQERQIALAKAKEAEESQAAAMQERNRATELKQQMSELNAKLEETNRGLVLTLGDVLFDFNQTTLGPGASRQLSPLARFLRENPERAVLIEGHTDSSGSDRYNQELSQRRADAVKDLLVQSGISPDRISTRGLGETLPLVSNDSAAGRQQNRRVEVIISN